MELGSRHQSGAYNFKVVFRFLENVCSAVYMYVYRPIKLGWIIRTAFRKVRAISIIVKWMLYKVEKKLKPEILVNVQVNITRTRESYCTAYSNAFHCITDYTTCTMIYKVLF
jgi:hypothetical protein